MTAFYKIHYFFCKRLVKFAIFLATDWRNYLFPRFFSYLVPICVISLQILRSFNECRNFFWWISRNLPFETYLTNFISIDSKTISQILHFFLRDPFDLTNFVIFVWRTFDEFQYFPPKSFRDLFSETFLFFYELHYFFSLRGDHLENFVMFLRNCFVIFL